MNLKQVDCGHQDVAFLQYTGGTTGVSKGATLTHRNVIANMLQAEAWYQPALAKLKPGEQMITVTALPLYHIFALTCCALLSMRTGGKRADSKSARYSGVRQGAGKHKFGVFPAVNTLFNALLNNDDFKKLDFKSLILSLGGGMAVQKAVAEKWLKLTGSAICEATVCRRRRRRRRAIRPIQPSTPARSGCRCRRPTLQSSMTTASKLPVGSVGEIAIRGPQVMAGYWQRPDETAKVMTPDGFPQRRHRRHGRRMATRRSSIARRT